MLTFLLLLKQFQPQDQILLVFVQIALNKNILVNVDVQWRSIRRIKLATCILWKFADFMTRLTESLLRDCICII